MKKISLLFLSVIFPTLFCCNALGNAQPKPVRCSVEIMPNYAWHLFALADIWNKGDSDYYKTYGHTVNKQDIEYLHRNRDLIAWGNGKVAPYTRILFFLPFYHEMSESDFFSGMEEVSEIIAYPEHEYAGYFGNINADTFNMIKDIFVRNFPAYKEEVWPEVAGKLDEGKKKIDAFFTGKDMIGDWEKALGMEYAGDGFFPVLTYANGIDHLASANDLSLSRNNFAYTEFIDINYITDLIIHEIGIFCFMPVMNAIYSDAGLQTEFNLGNGVIYQAIESFIEKKKGEVTGSSRLWEGKLHGGGEFNFPFFFDFYDANSGKYDNEQLIRMAIGAYNIEYNN